MNEGESDAQTIADNVARARERIANAAHRVGRNPKDITLIAVTKTVTPERVLAALRAGVTDVGENYIQEARAKIPEVNAACARENLPAPRWHGIGHLQTNKAKYAVDLFFLLQTVDNAPLAQEVGRQAAKRDKVLPVLLEVNLSGEEHRAGVLPESLPALVETVAALPALALQGLMGIPPVSDAYEAKRHFERLYALWETLPPANRRVLSVGMSGDFEQAIEAGATHVRIGTALFGRRG